MKIAAERLSVATGAIGVVAVASVVTVFPGTPRVFAPFNFLVVVPLMVSESFAVAYCVMPLAFAAWCWPVFGGATVVPKRSRVLVAFGLCLSALWIVLGLRTGTEYQSAGYVIGVSIVNLICGVGVVTMLVAARKEPSWLWNVAFHTALFTWLAWCAFPWLGELP